MKLVNLKWQYFYFSSLQDVLIWQSEFLTRVLPFIEIHEARYLKDPVQEQHMFVLHIKRYDT